MTKYAVCTELTLFHSIRLARSVQLNSSVLVQEFLAGKEYVVDSVSVEGIHKTVAIWEYDKREANNAKFVYYGMRLFESDSGEREDALVAYMHKVLDALGVRHGPSHGEIMWTSTGERAFNFAKIIYKLTNMQVRAWLRLGVGRTEAKELSFASLTSQWATTS